MATLLVFFFKWLTYYRVGVSTYNAPGVPNTYPTSSPWQEKGAVKLPLFIGRYHGKRRRFRRFFIDFRGLQPSLTPNIDFDTAFGLSVSKNFGKDPP